MQDQLLARCKVLIHASSSMLKYLILSIILSGIMVSWFPSYISNAATSYPKGPGGSYSDWTWPDNGVGYDSFEWDINMTNIPNRPDQLWRFTHYFAYNFSFINGSGGYTGMQDWAEGTNLHPGNGRVINYSIWNAFLGAESPDMAKTFSGEGSGSQTRISYQFQESRVYRMRIGVGPNGKDSTGTWWAVWIKDKTTGIENLVGQIKVPPTWGKLKPSSSMFGEDANWNLTASGTVTEYDCANFLKSTLELTNLSANWGKVRPRYVSNHTSSGSVSVPDGGAIKVSTESCPAESASINNSVYSVRHTINSLGGKSSKIVEYPPCDTSQLGVYVFEGANYTGRCGRLTSDAPSYTDIPVIGGDTTSSIKIVGSYKATLYQDPGFTGLYTTFTSDDPDLSNDTVGDNLVSSIKVENIPDTTAPSISFTAPKNMDTISGTVSATARFSDNIGVAGVELYIDNALTASTLPYSWDTNTASNGSHTLTVKAYDAAGNTGSETINVTVFNDAEAPTSPTGLSAAALAYNKVSLQWSPSTDNTGVAKYAVIRNGVTIGSTNATNYDDTSVQPQTTYSYQVVAIDAANNTSLPSNASSVTTPSMPDVLPPSVPTGVTASAASSSQINLSWVASTDNIGVAGYDIYRKTSSTAAAKVATVNAISYSDSSLASSTSYSYYVVAKDAAGNQSVQSATVTATTKAATITYGSATGIISDSLTGAPIAGAAVKIYNTYTSKTATTDSKGKYTIGNLVPATYTVTVNAKGYKTASSLLIISSGNQTTLNLSMTK